MEDKLLRRASVVCLQGWGWHCVCVCVPGWSLVCLLVGLLRSPANTSHVRCVDEFLEPKLGCNKTTKQINAVEFFEVI